MENEMIERVALAIFQAFVAHKDGDYVRYSSPTDDDGNPLPEGVSAVTIDVNRFDLRHVARAAIEAMREPSEAMDLSTEDEALWYVDDRCNSEHLKDPLNLYRAMIDAALKDA